MTDPDEVWEGLIDLPGRPLRIRVNLLTDGGSLDIPEQLAAGLPVHDVVRDEDQVSFAVPTLPGSPRFTGTTRGGTIRGTFVQGGTSAPFELDRVASSTQPPRPQDPRPPLPYRVEEIEIDRTSFSLSGSLTVPDDDEVPAVLLVSGSGSLDRDESIADHKPFLVLADVLTRAGFAVLRVDDRGVGGSGGVRGPVSYDDLAADAVANLGRLADHPAVDGSRLGIVGHSQGGNVAAMAASMARAGSVRGVVLLATPAVEGARVLAHQTRAILEGSGLNTVAVDSELAHLTQMIESVTAGDLETAARLHRQHARPSTADGDDGPDASARVAAEVLRHVIAYEPDRHLRGLPVPTLAIYGELDLQVSATENARTMRAALDHLASHDVLVLQGLNHLMQPARTGHPSEYAAIETTIDPAALTAIKDWLRLTL